VCKHYGVAIELLDNRGVCANKWFQQTKLRLIEFIAPDSERYQYLTNDFELEPGVIAFLYHRRWDLEKYFDNFKNDMANAKVWGKRREAIEQQSLLAMIF